MGASYGQRWGGTDPSITSIYSLVLVVLNAPPLLCVMGTDAVSEKEIGPIPNWKIDEVPYEYISN